MLNRLVSRLEVGKVGWDEFYKDADVPWQVALVPRDVNNLPLSPAAMRPFVLLLAVATAFTSVLAQYNDGYETVNSATDPVQIRLAYQGPTGMMGE